MYSRTKQISIFYIVEIIPRSLSSHRPREVGPGYLLEQTRLQKTVPSKVGLLLWPGEALLFLIPHWPRFTPCVRRRGAYSPYLKCIKRAGKSPYTTSACQKTHHITSGRFTPANIPPPGCSNTSSQKASSIFPKVLNARGFVAVAVTRASPSTRRNVIGHQVQSGSRGWGEEPPPPKGNPPPTQGEGASQPHPEPRSQAPPPPPTAHTHLRSGLLGGAAGSASPGPGRASLGAASLLLGGALAPPPAAEALVLRSLAHFSSLRVPTRKQLLLAVS